MSDEDLDFTKQGPPSAPLPPAKVAEARQEAASGGPQLDRSGFYVAMARRRQGGPVPPRDGQRHCVLVIEDDLAMLKLVAEVLTTAGFKVRMARNRAEINGEMNKAPMPDLILLDVGLPDADGFQILERIRATPKIAKMPVVMMTGKSEVADVARGLALNADGYLSKPFKVTALLSSVGTVLGLD